MLLPFLLPSCTRTRDQIAVLASFIFKNSVSFWGHCPDLIDWNSGLSISPSVHKVFLVFSLICHDLVCWSTSTRYAHQYDCDPIQDQGQRASEVPKMHFSRSISSAILAWSSKLMVNYDSIPSLQLVGAWFLGHRLGDDLVDWNWGVSVLPYVRPSVRLYVHKKFFRFPSNLVCG